MTSQMSNTITMDLQNHRCFKSITKRERCTSRRNHSYPVPRTYGTIPPNLVQIDSLTEESSAVNRQIDGRTCEIPKKRMVGSDSWPGNRGQQLLNVHLIYGTVQVSVQILSKSNKLFYQCGGSYHVTTITMPQQDETSLIWSVSSEIT